MRGIPIKFEKEINSIIWDFIWDGKTNQISRNVSMDSSVLLIN
jgi:hypothetical protein